MNTGTRNTFMIAATLIVGAIFPLVAIMLGCLFVGMGLHACLSSRPPGQGDLADLETELEQLRQQREHELSRRVEAATLLPLESQKKR